MMQVGQQSQRLLADFVKRQSASGNGPRDPLNLTGTFTALLKSMAANPTVIMEAQFQLWRDYMGLWERTANRMLGGDAKPVVAPASGDKRFKDKDWEENQIFDFIKQSYLLTRTGCRRPSPRSTATSTSRCASASSSIPSSSPTRSRRPIS